LQADGRVVPGFHLHLRPSVVEHAHSPAEQGSVDGCTPGNAANRNSDWLLDDYPFRSVVLREFHRAGMLRVLLERRILFNASGRRHRHAQTQKQEEETLLPNHYEPCRRRPG